VLNGSGCNPEMQAATDAVNGLWPSASLALPPLGLAVNKECSSADAARRQRANWFRPATMLTYKERVISVGRSKRAKKINWSRRKRDAAAPVLEGRFWARQAITD
jgi:hypothetical protein